MIWTLIYYLNTIIKKTEARENINHDEYVEDKNYHNVDNDDYDDNNN